MLAFRDTSSPEGRMIKLLRIILLISGVLTFSVFITLGVVYYLAANSLPQYEQQLKSSEINQSVSITRGSYAIPYIEAQNDHDSFFALGYTHAQDRLWQMVLLRRIAQGRLSEILGSSALEGDILMRTLSIYHNAQKSEKHQTKQVTSLLNSYSAGINTYIRQISEMGLGRGAPEFFLFTSEISPWQPADSIALIKLIAFLSTDKARLEIIRTQFMLAKISAERLNDIFEEPPLMNNQENQTFSFLNKSINRTLAKKNVGSTVKNIFSGLKEDRLIQSNLGASNIFAVMPFRSATGSTLAASDPHSAFTVPSNFMLVGMKLSGTNVIGGTIPGIPAILIGRGKNIGWGISSAKIDDQDLFIEKLNPKNKLEYFTETGLVKIKIKNEIIKIKDESSITLKIKTTKNGPILPRNSLGIHRIRPKGHEISMSWTGLSTSDRSIEALISIMMSQSIVDAKKNLPLLEAPGQNIMLVDKESVSLVTAGAIPERNINHNTRGMTPSLAWKEVNSWVGIFPFEKNPKVTNPKSGVIVNTNNKITDADFPYHVSYDWGDSQRIVRASNLLLKRQFHTVNSFKEIQTDTVSISARILLPLLAKELWFQPQSGETLTLTASEVAALEVLSAWNGDMNQNSSEPLIYVNWITEFQRLIMRDDLSDLYENITTIRPLFLERVLRKINGAEKWCDIIQTSTIETCDEMAKRALTIAIKKLERQFGPEINSWRWGEVHIAVHKPQITNSWPILSFFTNIVHEISGGDNTLMMSKTLNSSNSQFNASHGSTLRAIYDFSQNDAALFIISTGQSGHFLSQYYDDQSVLWQQEQYISVDLNKPDIDDKSSKTVFKPITKFD